MKDPYPLHSFFCKILLLLSLIGTAGCEKWNLEPRQFPKCDVPTATIAMKADRLTVEFKLANSTGTVDGVTWSYGDGKTEDSFTSLHTYARRGTYPVTAQLRNICGDKVTLSANVVVTDAVLPLVTTQVISQLTPNSIWAAMSLDFAGNDPILQYGVCYSTVQTMPTIANSVVTIGAGQPTPFVNYTFDLTQLSRGTTYYIRAYAVNSVGVGYGAVKYTTL